MEITVAQLDTDYEVLSDSITVVVSSDYTGPPGSSAGSAGHTIQDEGTNRTARTNLNFVGGGVTVTDDSGNDATVVTIPTGGVTDHGALTGLSDDDHTQYHTDARGDARYQPLDSDLTAIAALSTTSFGRAFLALADAAAGRTALGLGTAAVAATGDFDAAGAAAAAQAASQPLDSDLTAIAALSTTSYGRGLLTAANSTALGLVKGDVGLGNVDNTSDANKPVSTAQATADGLRLLASANLSDVASATTARTNLGAQQGPLTGDVTTSGAAATLASTGVTAGTYGSSAVVPVVTIDAKGRVTVATTTPLSLPRYGSLLVLGHSYTQLGGNNVQSNTSTDIQTAFPRRVAAITGIPGEETELWGKTGAAIGGASPGDATTLNAYGVEFSQGAGVILRHVLPPHAYSIGGTPRATSTAGRGLVLMMYGFNEALGNGLTSLSATVTTRAYKHGLRTAISRVMAAKVYDDDHSSIAYTGTWSTISTLTQQTGPGFRRSSTNGDLFTITVPSTFLGGTVGVCMFGGSQFTTTTTAAVTDLVGVMVTVAERAYYPQSGNFVILIDSEMMLVTAGHGTGAGTYTVVRGHNSTTIATHSSGATVSRPATTGLVTWSGTATGATGTTQLAGQGGNGQQVPVTKRFALTAADAGKTIIGTVSGMLAGETFDFDSWWIEDADPPTVLTVNQPTGSFGNAFATAANMTTANTDLASVVSEFPSSVAVVDAAATFAGLFNATCQAATSTSTTIHITPTTASTNLIGVGSVLRCESEEMLVTAITKTSDTDWSLTVTRGYTGQYASGGSNTNHAISTPIYDTRWLSPQDRVHPSDLGHELLSASVLATLATVSQSSARLSNAGGYTLRRQWRLADNSYLPVNPASAGTKAGATIGTLYTFPVYIPETAIITEFSSNVTAAANASGTLRWGLWTDGGSKPGVLILDAGTATQGSVAVRSVSAFQPVKAGWYWIGVAMQGTGTMATMRTITSGVFNDYPIQNVAAGVISAAVSASPLANGMTVTGVTGALASFTGFSSGMDTIPAVIATWIKLSVPVRDGT